MLFFITTGQVFSHAVSMYNSMIRALAILCKLNSLKLSDKQLLDFCLCRLDLTHQVCPSCGSSGTHAIYSSYKRTMITFTGGHRENIEITLPRIKCHCGHTHAIIPDVLIPYGSYSLRFILIVLYRYLLRSCSVAELCDKYQISRSTLYEWIHLFIAHFNLFVDKLNEIEVLCQSALNRIRNVISFPHSFSSRFKHSFMQPFHVTTNSKIT